MHWPEMRPRQPFTGLTLAAIAGIWMADRAALGPVVPAIVASALALWAIWRPRAWRCWLAMVAVFLSLHTLRHHGNPGRELARAFADGPQLVRATGIVQTEPELPAYYSPQVSCFFRLRLEAIELQGVHRESSALVNVAWAGPRPSYGDRLELLGSLRNLEPTRNPGQFDFTTYLQRQGIYSEIQVRFAEDGRIESHGHGWWLRSFAYQARHWIQQQLRRDFEDSPELTALIESMVLGMRGETPAETKELFQRTGTLHLFAVSGLNVAMLVLILRTLFRPLRIRGALAIGVIIIVLIFYAVVTGLSASCIRATIMGSLLLLAPLFDRKAVPYNSLTAAAFLILLWDTNQLFSPGFQFSFVLVLAIVYLAERIQAPLERRWKPDEFLPRQLWNRSQRWQSTLAHLGAGTVGVTGAAWLGSLPFTAGYFHLFSPISLVANFIAVVIAFLILALGVSSALAATFSTTLAVLFNNANWLAAQALLATVRFFAWVPGGHLYVEVPSLQPAPAAEITIFDLGEGGAVHLRSAGRDWLFDCGSNFAYDRTVLPYLRGRGVNRLDGLLFTHGDAQHLGGAFSALTDFRPKRLVESTLRDRSPTRSRFHQTLAAQHLGKTLHARGDAWLLSPAATARVLYPPAGLQRATADDKALVVRVEVAGRRLLFMADSGFGTEAWLLENETDLAADVLIKGHHDKDLSGTPDFLLRVAPQAVVCGQPAYGPAARAFQTWTDDVAARGFALFRQDRCGAVTLTIQPDGTLEARGFMNGQTFRSRAR